MLRKNERNANFVVVFRDEKWGTIVCFMFSFFVNNFTLVDIVCIAFVHMCVKKSQKQNNSVAVWNIKNEVEKNECVFILGLFI